MKNKLSEYLKKQEEKAKELGAKLKVNWPNIRTEYDHCIWQEGLIASFLYKGYTIKTEVVGDVRARLYKNGEEIATCNGKDEFFMAMYKHLHDLEILDIGEYGEVDEDVYKEKKKVLFLLNNNWIEYSFYKDGKEVCEPCVDDNSELLSEAIDAGAFADMIDTLIIGEEEEVVV